MLITYAASELASEQCADMDVCCSRFWKGVNHVLRKGKEYEVPYADGHYCIYAS